MLCNTAYSWWKQCFHPTSTPLKTEGRLALKGVVVNKTNDTGFNCEFLSVADNGFNLTSIIWLNYLNSYGGNSILVAFKPAFTIFKWKNLWTIINNNNQYLSSRFCTPI